MTKENLLKVIAEKGYVISYAANLNFATYDIVTKISAKVTYTSLAISIIGLIWPNITTYWITIPVLLMSIACIYTEKYMAKSEDYAQRGVKNTGQWNELKNLYCEVKDSDENTDFTPTFTRVIEIEAEFNNTAEYNQILFANWFAHFKLFCEKDYHWMDEQLHFSFWKDKLPGTFIALLFIMIIVGIVGFLINCPAAQNWLASLFGFCNC